MCPGMSRLPAASGHVRGHLPCPGHAGTCWPSPTGRRLPSPPRGPSIRDGPARPRISQHSWELCSPDHFRAGWRQLYCCLSTASARAPGPGPALCRHVLLRWGTTKRWGAVPLSPVTALHGSCISPFCKRGRATQVAQGSPRGTAVGQGRSGDLLHGGAPSEPSIQPLPRSLASIRPAASRLVPWPSPPKKAARQPVGGGRVAPRGRCGGAGRGERFLQWGDPD